MLHGSGAPAHRGRHSTFNGSRHSTHMSRQSQHQIMTAVTVGGIASGASSSSKTNGHASNTLQSIVSPYQRLLLYTQADLDNHEVQTNKSEGTVRESFSITDKAVQPLRKAQNLARNSVVALNMDHGDQDNKPAEVKYLTIDGVVNVTEKYKKEGAHLAVDVVISDNSKNEDSNEGQGGNQFLAFQALMDMSKNSARSKSVIVPSKIQMSRSVHELLRVFAVMLSSIPNIKKLCMAALDKGGGLNTSVVAGDASDDDGDLCMDTENEGSGANDIAVDTLSRGFATVISAPYFARFLHSALLDHCGVVNLTVTILQVLFDAYKELSSLEQPLVQLQESYKRLQTLHPYALATQMNTSLSLSKVRAMI